VSGLQQAWGFAWKALMAGELITAGLRVTGPVQLLQRSQNDVPTLIAAVAVIVVIGVAVEYFLFGRVDRRIRRKRGLIIDG
jgi:NitT/TauT family transport system permease protein